MASLSLKDLTFATLPLPGKLAIPAVICLVLGTAYYFAFHLSLEEEIALADAKHAQLETQLREAERRQQEYLRLTQELANREPIDRQNNRVLPEKAEIPAFLQDLNRLSDLSGLRIRTVQPRPEEPKEMYIRIPVSLSLTGRYHQLMRFFYNVSRLERAIGMENVIIRNPKLDAEGVALEVEVLATTFRRPGPDDPPPPKPKKIGAKK